MNLSGSYLPKGLSPRGGFYYDNSLWFSTAYRELPLSARAFLHDLINELKFDYVKKSGNRNKTKVYTNNGKVSFTEIQFKKRHGFSSATYLTARNRLIGVGLIKQTHRGGKHRGDMARYKILCVNDVLQKDRRWERYPVENWKHKIPIQKTQLVGKKTQWKKGQTGRKKSSTLIKYTHNGALPPNKEYPYQIKPPNKIYP